MNSRPANPAILANAVVLTTALLSNAVPQTAAANGFQQTGARGAEFSAPPTGPAT